jgi:transcriptional regulator with XRE-family HTH domain
MSNVAGFGDVFAANVRAERARRRWSQQELADRAGLSRTTIGDLGVGKRRVTADHIPALCRAFGLPLSEMVRGADPLDLEATGLT